MASYLSFGNKKGKGIADLAPELVGSLCCGSAGLHRNLKSRNFHDPPAAVEGRHLCVRIRAPKETCKAVPRSP